MSTDAEKSCTNCGHRSWIKCKRTGFYCDTELTYGGRCAQGTSGTELLLWVPRANFASRVRAMLSGAQIAEGE